MAGSGNPPGQEEEFGQEWEEHLAHKDIGGLGTFGEFLHEVNVALLPLTLLRKKKVTQEVNQKQNVAWQQKPGDKQKMKQGKEFTSSSLSCLSFTCPRKPSVLCSLSRFIGYYFYYYY